MIMVYLFHNLGLYDTAYDNFLVRGRLLTGKLLGQGYKRIKLITTFKKCYDY